MDTFDSFFLIVGNNVKLNIRQYGDVCNAVNTLIVAHGYGEHQAYYSEMAEYFAQRGYCVVTYDLRSHGLSDGKRGYVSDFSLFVDDLNHVIRYYMGIKPESRFYMFGHSLGGSIVLNYLLKYQNEKISKAVISSPWLKLAFDPPRFKKILANIGNAWFPSLVIKGELVTDNLSRDTGFVKRFDDDPMTYDKISPAYYVSTVAAGLNALEKAALLKTPVLITHGDDDRITSSEASEQFCSAAGRLATFKSWDGGYRHVVFSESDKDIIFRHYYKYLSAI
jgi:alpha-beta hydrolase superfamily lysophospholipase